MAKDNTMGIVKIVLIIILALLLLSLASTFLDFVFGGGVARIITLVILVLVVIWLLSKEGQRKVKTLLRDIE